MGAFKKIEGRYLYVDFEKIKVPSFQMREMQKKAMAKTRLLKKVDPFARCIGRKRAFETPEELKKACDNYFKEQECLVYDKWGRPLTDSETGEYIKDTKPLTISGLARSIGISCVTLRRYQEIAESGTVPIEFANVVTDALNKIEEYAESQMYNRDGQRGGQFVLQAGFRWNTRKEESEIQTLSVKNKIELEKLRLQKEEHRLKMEMLKAGLDGGEDSEIKVTIKRAGRDQE